MVTRLIAPATGALIFCQCAFFNMFYNARVSYDAAYQAHQKLLKQNPDSIITALPSDIISNYDRAIEKASKVMEEYPNKKKWHDDALFLIGKANYFKGEYEKALRNFKILREEFQTSPFIPESYVFCGRCYIKMENFDKAEEMFDWVLEKYPDLDADQEITLLKVEIALKREGKAMAVDLLEKTNDRIKSKEKKIDLSLKIVRLYMDLKLYDKAINRLRLCERDKKFPEKLFLIDFMLAGCFEAKDSLVKALDMYNAMLDNRIYTWHVPEILLKKAMIYEKMGKLDESIATYNIIIERYAPAEGKTGAQAATSQNTLDAVENAWYQLGCIYQLKKGNFAKAKEYFGKIATSAKDTAIRNSSARRIKSIDTLMAYIGTNGTIDTIKNRGHRDTIAFKVGELFWLELDLPDSAYAHFKKLAVESDSLRPKALYSAGYIARTALKDTLRSDSIYNVLLKNYPTNAYTKMAQKDRGGQITVHTRQDSAQDAFLKAESLFINSEKPEEAVSAFKGVYDAFPDCEQGMKALYAAGWVSNDVLNNNKSAYKFYRMLCDSFPKSDICVNQVKLKLKTVSDTLAARKSRKGLSDAHSSAASPVTAKEKKGNEPSGTVEKITGTGKSEPKKEAETASSVVPARPDTIKHSQSDKPVASPAITTPIPRLPPPPLPKPAIENTTESDSTEVIGETR